MTNTRLIRSATPVLGFVARSGTGKTTLLCKLLPLLKQQGFRVALIKHSHHSFEIDKPGKDSYQLREAGANQVLVASSRRWALMVENQNCSQDPQLQYLLDQLNHSELDLIMVEGFKNQAFPKIELARSTLNNTFFYPEDHNIIALASDEETATSRPIIHLNINDPSSIVQYIVNNITNNRQEAPATPTYTPASVDTNNSDNADDNMPYDPSCMDDYDPHSLLVDDALRRISASVQPITETESVNLRQGLNRVLATAVRSSINVPSHTNSAMDGYAIVGTDIPDNGNIQLKVIGTIMAGAPIATTIQPGECARIMTGGKMPAGADTVVMQERVQCNDQHIIIDATNKAGQNVRLAGEDIPAGKTILSAGKQLTPADIGLVASIGVSTLDVYRKIRVAFLSTGDELKPVGEPLGEGQIYDSNRYTLFAMLSRFGAEITDLGVIKDDQAQIKHAIESAAAKADVLITSGGVSVGEADYVKQVLDALGKVNFWKIAMKPGRPLAFGKIKRCLFFGLPGNPVSSMVTFYQFVLPALKQLSNQSSALPLLLKLPCISPLKKSPGRVEYQRGRILADKTGNYVVSGVGEQGSGILSSMSQANCFIILPLEAGNVAVDTLVTVQPFEGLI